VKEKQNVNNMLTQAEISLTSNTNSDMDSKPLTFISTNKKRERKIVEKRKETLVSGQWLLS